LLKNTQTGQGRKLNATAGFGEGSTYDQFGQNQTAYCFSRYYWGAYFAFYSTPSFVESFELLPENSISGGFSTIALITTPGTIDIPSGEKFPKIGLRSQLLVRPLEFKL
jgi:hypothetical protein